MSLFGIGAPTSTAAVATAGSPTITQRLGLSAGTLTGNDASAGGLMAQPGSGGSILKKMLVGGVIGAGLGFGASFLSLPVIGGLAAPVVAAIGGGIGAVAGLAIGLFQRRKANLAMQAQQQVAPGAGTAPVNIPRPLPGKVLKVGSSGPTVSWQQRTLRTLGLYKGKITGKYDAATANAVRRYEVLKGVMPTGESSPDLRVAVMQDVRHAKQYV